MGSWSLHQYSTSQQSSISTCHITRVKVEEIISSMHHLLSNTLNQGIREPQRERGYAALLNGSYQYDYQMHISNMSINSENQFVTHAASVALGLFNPFLLLHLIVGVGLSNYKPQKLTIHIIIAHMAPLFIRLWTKTEFVILTNIIFIKDMSNTLSRYVKATMRRPTSFYSSCWEGF